MILMWSWPCLVYFAVAKHFLTKHRPQTVFYDLLAAKRFWPHRDGKKCWSTSGNGHHYPVRNLSACTATQ